MEKKVKRTLSILAIAGLCLVGVTGAAQAQTITEIVAASGDGFDTNGSDYDILLEAVVTANLAGALGDPDASLTVFAPNDRAFIRLAKSLGFDGANNDEQGAWDFLVVALAGLGDGVDPVPVLTEVLLYHVAPGEIGPIQIIILSFFNQTIPTLQGNTIRPRFFRLKDADPDLPDPRLRFPLNIIADNGRIHTINRVLLPIDI